MPMSQENAEIVGLRALAWLAAHEELMPVFQGASGAGEADLRSGATDPAFLGAVLDFVLMDDTWVTQMCDANGLSYDQPMMARAALPGGDQVHWT